MSRHIFKTRLENTKIFKIFLYGYSLVQSMFLRSRNSILVTASMIVIAGMSAFFRARIAITASFIERSYYQAIIRGRNSISYTIKTIEKITSIMRAFTRINFRLSLLSRFSILIRLPRIRISPTARVGKLFLLGTYDPQTLGTLDTQTIGAMDFLES